MSTRLVIGLTGGIASGKTAVSDLFAGYGVPVVDADIAAREVVEPGTAGLRRLVEAFGPVLDAHGALDRRRLREIVFTDPAARERLNGILHPLIQERLASQLAALEAPYALLVVPLLIGSKLVDMVDRVLVVDVPVELQRQRVVARDRCSIEQADAIIASQSSREQRLEAADDVIVNDGELAHLQPQIAALHERYLQLAAKRAVID